MAERESWKSSIGFMLAAVGSAVGLGNLWRFAYRASEGGGAAFVVLYVVIVALVGVPLLTAEFVMGRHTRTSCVRALAQIGGPRWKWLGIFFVLVGFGILSYYSVIMGWTARVLIDTLRGAVPEDTGAYFATIAEGPSAILFHVLSMAITVAIVGGGVRKGIERASLILLPLLGVLIIGLAVWAATLSGAGAGYAFYLRPDLHELFRLDTLSAAAGQAFFSLSLGMGAMLTYASYLEGQTNLAKEAGQVALVDTGVAFMGGLVTFPIIYHFALQGAVSESTIGALFIALPRGFHALGPSGVVVGAIFFVALYIAALTSAFSLLEVATAPIIDGLGWPRRKAVLAAGLAVTLVGIPSALDTDFLGRLDKWVGEVALVFGGVMIAVLVGYLWWPSADAELAKGFPTLSYRRAWFWLLRIVVPILLLLALYGVVKPVLSGS